MNQTVAPASRRLTKSGTLAADHQRTGDHIMQRLLARGEASHDVTDKQNQAGEVFREMTSSSAREGNTVAVFFFAHVGT